MPTHDIDLWKAGLLLLGAWCCSKAFTSPTPVPRDEEQKQYRGSTSGRSADPLAMALPVRTMTTIFPIFYYALNAVEFLRTIGFKEPFHSQLDQIGNNLHIATPERVIGLILIIAGTGLRIACYRSLAQHFTFELSLKKDHKLVTDGPYAFVRHPSYIGGFAVHLGCLLFNLGRGAWWAEYAVTSSFGTLWVVVAVMQASLSALFIRGATLRCKVEDDMMREYFKAQWDSWAKKTRYRLIPFVF